MDFNKLVQIPVEYFVDVAHIQKKHTNHNNPEQRPEANRNPLEEMIKYEQIYVEILFLRKNIQSMVCENKTLPSQKREATLTQQCKCD